MISRRFFHFHLATLFVAALIAGGVLYLNLRNYREPFVYSGFASRSGGVRFVMQADGKCVRESLPTKTTHALTRVYLENPGWPYSLWENINQIDVPSVPRDFNTLRVSGEEWDKAQLTSFALYPFLYRDEEIAKRAPHFLQKIYDPPERAILRLPTMYSKELLKNVVAGFLIVLIPSIALEWSLRRRDSVVRVKAVTS